jgi:hypothetical protein
MRGLQAVAYGTCPMAKILIWWSESKFLCEELMPFPFRIRGSAAKLNKVIKGRVSQCPRGYGGARSTSEQDDDLLSWFDERVWLSICGHCSIRILICD